MQHSPPRFNKTEPTIGLAELSRYVEGWLLSGDIDRHSQRTLGSRREIADKLLWFLKQKVLPSCGVHELRQFFHYCSHGHKEPGGRWDNPRMTKPVRPRTVHTYHGHLRTLFRWIVSEGGMEASPMERIPIPTSRPDQIQPFSADQVNALLTAARKSRHPHRDEALLYFLLDTGVRASELCGLQIQDADMTARVAKVLGKGDKSRSVPFQKTTAKALWSYLKEDDRDPEDPLFQSERGDALTRSGLLQLLERLGEMAAVSHVRCSPHTFRHTMAVMFLKAGGNVFTLKELLGHTSLHMTNKYVALAQADIEAQHRQYSPVEFLKKKGR